MKAEKPKRLTTPAEEGIELHPDAWKRFERTVDAIVKSAPVPRNRSGKKGKLPRIGGRSLAAGAS
jgi:hypothetical protein